MVLRACSVTLAPPLLCRFLFSLQALESFDPSNTASVKKLENLSCSICHKLVASQIQCTVLSLTDALYVNRLMHAIALVVKEIEKDAYHYEGIATTV